MNETRTAAGRFAPEKTGRNFHTYHDSESPAKLSTTVIHALADVMGSDVTNAGFVLNDNINPDALDRTFANYSDNHTRRLAISPLRWRSTVSPYTAPVRSSLHHQLIQLGKQNALLHSRPVGTI
jgi:hypothetical protein